MTAAFTAMAGHEQVVFGNDPGSGLRCIVAVYSTALGPGLGGTRMHPYADEGAALHDVLRLSRAMAYKAAVAGLDLGGAKAVVIGDPARDKSEALFRAYGRVIASLAGRYITACDVGTTPDDMALIGRETRWATGAPPAEGGSGDSGILTAHGVAAGLRACAAHVFGAPSLRGRHVAIQGVGKVGRRLADLLHEEGARLTVADVDPAAVAVVAERTGAEVVDVDTIHRVDADVLSPNALGATLDERTIPELGCRLVAGAANNQLATDEDADRLADHGIVYAPDYVLNAGGLIQVASELDPDGYVPERARARVEAISGRMDLVLRRAKELGVTPAAAADRVAEERMAAVGRLRGFWLPTR